MTTEERKAGAADAPGKVAGGADDGSGEARPDATVTAAGGHDSREACRPAQEHELLVAAAVAGHRARAACEVLNLLHVEGCSCVQECDCRDVVMQRATLPQYVAALEGEMMRVDQRVDDALTEALRVIAEAGEGRFPPLPPAREPENESAHEAALVAVQAFAVALRRLWRCHETGCEGCDICEMVRGFAEGAEWMASNIEQDLIGLPGLDGYDDETAR
jgi:hypothetical protein